ncbi:MAG TPA: response regulator [Polyangiaceae bacterium]
MTRGFYSLVSPPPPGFEPGVPSRAAVLGGSVALYASSLEDATATLLTALRAPPGSALSGELAERVTALLIAAGATWRVERVARTLWYLEVPEPRCDDLMALCAFLLEELESRRRWLTEREHGRLELERKELSIQRLRASFNEATENGLLRIRALEKEHAMRLAAEESLRHSEKMRVVGQLAGGIAHDFNNMLTGIRVAAELLMHSVRSPDERDLVEIIEKAAERAGALTRQLLSFSRKEHLPTKPIDVHEAIRQVQALLERIIDKRIEITSSLDAAISVVEGDAAQIEVLLLNLGMNAAQAMPNGGRVCFSTRNRVVEAGDPSSEVLPSGSGMHIEITVEDNGVGISPDVLPRIFEPFFTTKPAGEGTGLGLAAVYAAVRDHSGGISVESEVGKGTKMRVLLPTVSEPKGIGIRPPNRVARGTGTVLVIDDEELIRKLVITFLGGLGYTVLEAADGIEGIRMIEESTVGIELVLLDLIMPRMTGVECFARIRALAPEMPVVLVSGFAADHDVKELSARGAAGFLRKPFGIEELSRVIADALRSRSR